MSRLNPSRHTAINVGLLTAWLLLMALMQTLDADPDQALADDAAQARQTAKATQRERHTRQSVCLRTAGFDAEPAELPDGTFTCRSAKSTTVATR